MGKSKNKESKSKEGKSLFLSGEERASLENLMLKKQVLLANVDAQVAGIEKQQEVLVARIEKRIGAKLKDFVINIESGELTGRDQTTEKDAAQKTE